MLKRLFLLAFVTIALFAFIERGARPALGDADVTLDHLAVVQLGERLFPRQGFWTRKGALPAFNAFFNRSWVSFRFQDKQRLALRNSPTLLDAGAMPRLHYDGEFASL